jgi:hypothetical protein
MPLGNSAAFAVVRAMEQPDTWWADAADIAGVMRKRFASETSAGLLTARQAKAMSRKWLDRMLLETSGERNRIATAIKGAKRFRMEAALAKDVIGSGVFDDVDEAAATLSLCRTPFPVVWLEVDTGDVVEGADGKAGFLVERINPEHPDQWIVTTFRIQGDEAVRIPFSTYVVSCEGRPLTELPHPYRYIQGIGSPLSGPHDHLSHSGLGVAGGRTPWGTVWYAAPKGYSHSLGLATMPLMVSTFENRKKKDGATDASHHKAVRKEAIGLAGRLKAVVGILATINHLEHTISEPNGKRYSGDRKGALDIATIMLGSGSRSNGQSDGFTNAIRRQLHDVRGHDRTYRNPDGSVRMVTWVKEHERGAGHRKLQRDYRISPSIPADAIPDDAPIGPRL